MYTEDFNDDEPLYHDLTEAEKRSVRLVPRKREPSSTLKRLALAKRLSVQDNTNRKGYVL